LFVKGKQVTDPFSNESRFFIKGGFVVKKRFFSPVLPVIVTLIAFWGLFPHTSFAATYTAAIDHVVDGDTVYLKETIQGTIIDQYHYSSSIADKSWVRMPDGEAGLL
jgi:hypothetical protein